MVKRKTEKEKHRNRDRERERERDWRQKEYPLQSGRLKFLQRKEVVLNRE